MKKITIETCAGSVEECMRSYEGGADRIELNNAVHMGGLTPSYATVSLARQKMPLPIIAMVRPRAGGFHYSVVEVETMFIDAEKLIEAGADGLVFGFLKADGGVDAELTRKMVELCHDAGKEAVFHRAIDVTPDIDKALELLIACGVDRVLTSGQKDKAVEATALLKRLMDTYGDKIEFVLGSGVNSDNLQTLITETGMNQVHASFKGWHEDPTTQTEFVSYRYSDAGDFDGVSLEKLNAFVKKSQSL